MSLYTHPSVPSNYDVEDAFSSTNAPNYTLTSPDYSRDFFPPEDISPTKDTETPVESPIPVSPSSSVGSSSSVRSTTPPLDYPYDESIFVELDNSLWIIPRPLRSEPVPDEPDDPRLLGMGDEHLNTILEKESDEFIKSSVENLVPILSESKDISDDECELPLCD
ncbi:hypothetical protein Tco_0232262 [Tanacetum coccineum]